MLYFDIQLLSQCYAKSSVFSPPLFVIVSSIYRSGNEEKLMALLTPLNVNCHASDGRKVN